MYRDLVYIAVALFTWGIGEGMFLIFDPIYLTQLGAEPVKVGAILGSIGINMVVTQIPAGYLADRFGRRALLLAAWILGVISTGIMAGAVNLSWFVIGRLAYGLTAWVMTPLNSYITAARGKMSVGRAITLVSATYSAGSIVGPFFGGVVGDWIGLRATYGISAGIFLLSTVVIWQVRSQPIDLPPVEGRNFTWLKNSRFSWYLVFVFLTMFSIYLPQPLTPNFLQEIRGYHLSEIGGLMSVGNFGVVILNLVFGQFAARTGFLLSQVSVALFALILWRGGNLFFYGLGYFFVSGYRVARSLATAQVRDFVASSRMGLAYGITETASLVATIFAPPLAGLLYSYMPSIIYPVSTVLIIFMLMVNIAFHRFVNRAPQSQSIS